MYTIRLNDGNVIGNLKLVNNTLRRAEEMTAAMFRGKLSPVTISGVSGSDESEDWGGLAGEHECMSVCYVKKIGDDYALALADVDPVKLENERRDANIEYIAMMTGVEL